MEIGDGLNLREIETAFSRFKTCPKCGSGQGFWLGSKDDHAYAYCKGCGAKFQFFEIYPAKEKNKNARSFSFFRK